MPKKIRLSMAIGKRFLGHAEALNYQELLLAFEDSTYAVVSFDYESMHEPSGDLQHFLASDLLAIGVLDAAEAGSHAAKIASEVEAYERAELTRLLAKYPDAK